MSDQLTLFAEGSLARMSAQPANERASTVPGRDYGSSTPDLLANYDQDTSSWRTSQGCFLGEWETFSESWPRSGMMRNGTAYQLPPLVHLTDVTGYGSLPTPTNSMMTMGDLEQARWAGNDPKRPSYRYAALYPTPSHTSYGSNQGGAMGRTGPVRHSLESMARTGMWPTPTVMTNTGGAAMCKWCGAGARKKLRAMATSEEINGALNPAWVSVLMGFPPNWTEVD